MRCLRQIRTVTYRAGTPEQYTVRKGTLYIFKNASCYIRLPTATEKGAIVSSGVVVDLLMIDNMEETTLEQQEWIYPHLYKNLKSIYMKYQFRIVSNFEPRIVACDSITMFDGDGFEYEFQARDTGKLMLEQMGPEQKIYEVETYRDKVIITDVADYYEESYMRHY